MNIAILIVRTVTHVTVAKGMPLKTATEISMVIDLHLIHIA